MQTMLKIKKVKVCKRDYEEGLWIPKKVLKNHDLNSGEKKLLSLIIGLSKKCVCFATNKYFSEYFGQCLSSTQKQLRGLKEKGYIEIDQSAEIDERIGTTFRIVKVKKND